MAENTPISRKFLGNTTEELSALHGKEKQLVIDTVKNTAVVMDGSTAGGHPLAKEAVKIKSGTDGIKINDGTESNLASDITITADPSVCITLHDGQIDFDDPEQIDEITENLPNGQLVVSDCCDNCPDDAVYINGNWNTEEWLTESGEYEVPVTGWYEVTVIDGGNGGYYAPISLIGYGGEGKAPLVVLKHYTAGQVIPVTIGAGGGSVIVGQQDVSVKGGGTTSFGDIVCNGADFTIPGSQTFQYDDSCTITRVYAAGGGTGGGFNYNDYNGCNYGAGGGVSYDASDSSKFRVGNGYQGAIRLRYYDASKDKNISIDMASSITIKELQDQITALAARVQELENE